MNWSKRIRQAHRWFAIAFTAAVIANVAAQWREASSVWVGLLALLPLVLLMATGLYLFVLPHVAKRRPSRG